MCYDVAENCMYKTCVKADLTTIILWLLVSVENQEIYNMKSALLY